MTADPSFSKGSLSTWRRNWLSWLHSPVILSDPSSVMILFLYHRREGDSSSCHRDIVLDASRRRGKSWHQLEGDDLLSLRHFKRVSGKRKDHRWEKMSNIFRSEDPTCSKQGVESCITNIYNFEEKDRDCILFSRGGMDTPDCVNKRAGEKKVYSWYSGASMHMGAELETGRTSRSPTTMMTVNDEMQTREGTMKYVKLFDLFVMVLLLKQHSHFLLSWNSMRIMDIIITGPAVKDHISSVMTRELIGMFPTVYLCGSWLII